MPLYTYSAISQMVGKLLVLDTSIVGATDNLMRRKVRNK